ncbi:MAG: TolC family protein [Phycisphaerales bacterium]
MPLDTAYRGRLAVALTLSVLLQGCQSSPLRSDPVPDIQVRSGVDPQLRLHNCELPIDQAVDGEYLPLERAVALAVERAPDLQAALARTRLAAAEADQSRKLPNPVLDFILRWGPGKPQFEISFAHAFVQVLQMPRRTSAADNRLRETAAGAIATALDVIEETQTAYAEARADAASIPVLEARLAVARKLEDLARSRVEAGEATSTDVSIARSQVSAITVELESVKRQAEHHRLHLARLVGAPSSPTRWRFSTPPTIPESAAESQWISVALSHQPNILEARWRLASLEDVAALAAWSVWEQSTLGADAQRDDAWFVGPSFSVPIPIFDDGSAARAGATAAALEARHKLTAAARTAIQDVRDAWNSYASVGRGLRTVRDDLLPTQRQRRLLVEESYRAGQLDITAVDLAEQDLRAAELQELQSERDLWIARAKLERAAGGPSIAAGLMKLGTGPAAATTPCRDNPSAATAMSPAQLPPNMKEITR